METKDTATPSVGMSPTGYASGSVTFHAKPPSIPDYELIRSIGGGAYGDVWLGCSTTGVFRAVKIVWRHTFEDERPFQREFEGIQRVERISREHPSQLALFHVGRNEAAGYFYYVMELADAIPSGPDGDRLKTGGAEIATYAPHTLRSELEQHGRLPAPRVLEIGLALAEALKHLHANGLVHRDVKPSNVIFVKGRPKLADIGLVTNVGDTRSIVGTEGYLAPEGPGTAQADLFALGKVLYEAVTGLDRRQLPHLPRDVRAWPDAKAFFELNEVILKACESDPIRRYSTVEEMLRELSLLNQGGSVQQKHARLHYGAVAKKAAVAACVGCLLMFGAWRLNLYRWVPTRNSAAVGLYNLALEQMQTDTLPRRLEAYSNLTAALKLEPKWVEPLYAMYEAYFDFFIGEKLPPHHNQMANFRDVRDKLFLLAPDSAQYHTVNSQVKWGERKYEEAIEEAELATRKDPMFLRGHSNYALYVCRAHGDADRALKQLEIAEQINSNDVYVHIHKSGVFLVKREFDRAIKELLSVFNWDDRATQLHLNLGNVYEDAGKYRNALDEYEKFDLLNGKDPAATTNWYNKLKSELEDHGSNAVWHAELNRELERKDPDYYQMARLSARLGDTNEVCRLLNVAYTNHPGSMESLLIEPCFAALHGDPRFKQLVTNMGFRPIPGFLK